MTAQTQIVTWKKNGLRLRLITEFNGRQDEPRYMVCKEHADPIMGRFSVRTDEVEAA